MSPLFSPIEQAASHLPLSPAGRRLIVFTLLACAGWLDYATGPRIASSPFYIVILLVLAFLESWGICLVYSFLAAAFYLVADLAGDPSRVALVFPYWTAFARFFSFSLITVAFSQLVVERRLLRESRQILEDRQQELARKNAQLDRTLQEVRRLQAGLILRERQAAASEAIYLASYEMERPLASLSVYAEELGRLIARTDDDRAIPLLAAEMRPLIEKVGERTLDMEAVLQNVRRLRDDRSRAPAAAEPPDPELGG